jgi:hypothetical protein
METRINDYLGMGVRYVWLIDPWTRRAWVYTADARVEAAGALQTQNPDISIPLAEIFSGMK